MKKLFIDYDLALLAKSKGFDKPCMATYEIKSKCLKPRGGLTRDWFNELNDNKGFEWKISAPTHQQIIDWLRDTHGLVVTSNHYLYNVEKFTACVVHRTTEIVILEQDYTDFYEALNVAILFALQKI